MVQQAAPRRPGPDAVLQPYEMSSHGGQAPAGTVVAPLREVSHLLHRQPLATPGPARPGGLAAASHPRPGRRRRPHGSPVGDDHTTNPVVVEASPGRRRHRPAGREHPERLNATAAGCPSLAQGLGLISTRPSVSDWGCDFTYSDAIANLVPGTPVLATTTTANAPRVLRPTSPTSSATTCWCWGPLDGESLHPRRSPTLQASALADADRGRHRHGLCLSMASTAVAGLYRSRGAPCSLVHPEERERLEAALQGRGQGGGGGDRPRAGSGRSGANVAFRLPPRGAAHAPTPGRSPGMPVPGPGLTLPGPEDHVGLVLVRRPLSCSKLPSHGEQRVAGFGGDTHQVSDGVVERVPGGVVRTAPSSSTRPAAATPRRRPNHRRLPHGVPPDSLDDPTRVAAAGAPSTCTGAPPSSSTRPPRPCSRPWRVKRPPGRGPGPGHAEGNVKPAAPGRVLARRGGRRSGDDGRRLAGGHGAGGE